MGEKVNWVSNTNKYVVVTADSDVAYAKNVSQFIHNYLQERISESSCYTYENIRCQYVTFSDEKEKIEQFLSMFDCGIGFQNIFWMFMLTPNTQPKGNSTAYCDPQFWYRAGKIIGQLCSKTAIYKNQVSFWVQRGTIKIESEQNILGGTFREFGPDFK